ncbi:trypsin-like peptidase domain-containing protein [Mesorhizobium amorphae]|uniref:trypsin-like serine peptidase n=1 Tax=Mesorhizobium amorphae TaxID=71433 RepID=UPI003ED00EC4
MDGAIPAEAGLSLSDAELDTFAAICAREVAPIQMENLARERGLVDDFEVFTKETMSGQAEPIKALNRAILTKLNDRGILLDIAERMFFEIPWTADSKRIVAGYTRSVRIAPEPKSALEGLLTERDHFILNENIGILYNEISPTVGLLFGNFIDQQKANSIKLGTAFLVGPDLILTARHNFDGVGDPNDIPKFFKVVFDYDSGSAVQNLDDLDALPGVRVVGLDRKEKWPLVSSDAVAWAGTIAKLNDKQVADLAEKLDFALVRLDTPIGNEPSQTGARARRGWLKLAMPTGPFPYALQTQVVMPQHPGGMPLRHSFGRIVGDWDGATRIIYDLNSAKGSSGAPCLNGKMEVIGVHSAAYTPVGAKEENLAVRIDVVLPRIAAHLNALAPTPPAPTVWRAYRADRSLVPIIGREKLQVWCDAALKGSTAISRSRSDRVYAADAQSARAGKTFTSDILRTLLIGQQGHNIVVIGGKTSAMPETAEEFINVFAAGFGMNGQDLGDTPARPGASLPQGAKDGDKLDRWLSQDLPEWFAGRLSAHRPVQVNRSEAAKRLVEANNALARPNTPEDVELASADPPIIAIVERWHKAWVLFEDLDERPLSPEVRRFVAGLIGADVDENAIDDVRSAIQWLFLGRVPDFLVAPEMAVETIRADVVAPEALTVTISAAITEAEINIDAASVATAILLTAPSILKAEYDKENVELSLLSVCQRMVADLIAGLYEKGGHKL